MLSSPSLLPVYLFNPAPLLYLFIPPPSCIFTPGPPYPPTYPPVPAPPVLHVSCDHCAPEKDLYTLQPCFLAKLIADLCSLVYVY